MKKRFSFEDLLKALFIALAGYLANTVGLVDLPSFY
jgi:hypothetical protein